MDLFLGMAIGVVFATPMGYLLCAILSSGKREDEMYEMMRLIREYDGGKSKKNMRWANGK